MTATALSGPSSRLPRWVLAVALVTIGAVAIVDARAVRTLEAKAMAAIVGGLTGSSTRVVPGRAAFYWLMGTEDARGLRITPECSIAYLVGPLLVLAAILVVMRRLPAARVLAAALAGVSLIVTVNLLRMAMVAVAVTEFESDTAMWWWHNVIGSLVSLLGAALSLGLALRIAFGTRRLVLSEEPAERRPPGSS